MDVIRTRWHHVREMAQREVYLSAPPEGTCLTGPEVGLDKPAFEHFLGLVDKLPRFVIDPELVGLITTKAGQKSLLDMKKAGVLRLPYPTMVVEIPRPNRKHIIAILRDRQATEPPPWQEAPPGEQMLPVEEYPFYVLSLFIHHDEDGDYLVTSPSIAFATVYEHEQGESWFRFQCQGVGWLPNTSQVDELVGKTYNKDIHQVAGALFSALLLLSTQGMERQVIDVERLNRKRIASNKPPIPRHTYIHIGRVYRSAKGEESDTYVPRRSPIPHWRRGHARRYHFGPGKTQVKWKWIDARWVAWLKDADVEEEAAAHTPEYIVKQ